ncbi:hypothetical protein BUZ62_06235 [Staphylococcus pasteuri]|uniref:stage II sporulation protein M n=1 Tax=Staphylococcus pasteuri TaxID=45972 RepID=UPI000D364E84|nr:stage II sporulation protein M [Staphylococcus pasteuri]PTU87071.1 hypothetical protein BUZ62_06235 [Staphylococcus pasteuri]
MFEIKDENYVKRAFKVFICTMIVLMITFILALIFSPSLETFKHIGDKVSITATHGLGKVWQYIVNNGLKTPLQMFILSLIPIPFLYCLNLISTTVITGIIFGFAINFDLHKGIIMVVGAIPHAIIELLAFCFVVSALYKFNQAIVRKVSNTFRKTKKTNYSIKLAFANLVKIYVLIALPLYIIAAFLETYFTDFINNLFS